MSIQVVDVLSLVDLFGAEYGSIFWSLNRSSRIKAMNQLHADCSASISELKKNPTALLSEADGAPIAILNHNKPAAYLIPAETYEWLLERLDDYELGKLVVERQAQKAEAIEVNLDEL